MEEALWGMGLGAAMLVYGLCRWRDARGRRLRRCKLCLVWGGGLFALGLLFASTPQPWGRPVLWIWGCVAVGLLTGHELFAPKE